ncbi:FAD-dependent oxidoreductase [Leifsonia sp. F6_8S_P_1B]|uniref:FAD-dependent oxidoreductase n=1 Tax=Leifsonia williamsii TaxID=3035919 RepID=A0ABT8KF05_9MICO|nr:FAD-dependent oxidoreductase [Leifsonia williamsii]MDN4616039.1 FAD-dependent oxidoreductase [Leifsonia williamsii]
MTLVDRYGVGNTLSSSSGTTRLWRRIDTLAWRARALAQAVAAMERLEALVGARLQERRGLCRPRRAGAGRSWTRRAWEAGISCMPAPGLGYKVGLDRPLRALDDGDADREPDREPTAMIRERVARTLPGLPTTTGAAQVCSWTDSPDGDFVIDRLLSAVTIACGDSGEGFTFAALVGERVADLVEGRALPEAHARWSLGRFSGRTPASKAPSALGRH